MELARILAYVTGTVDQELLARNEYLAAENLSLLKINVTAVGRVQAGTCRLLRRIWRNRKVDNPSAIKT